MLLGVSYRSDVGDTRYSPVEPFYLNCIKNKAIVHTHDPYVQYWEEVNIKVSQDLDKKLEMSWDIIVFSAGHTVYKNSKTISKICKMSNVKILDTIGLLKQKDISMISKKILLKSLGEEIYNIIMKRKVLILGGGGFIGFGIARILSKRKI